MIVAELVSALRRFFIPLSDVQRETYAFKGLLSAVAAGTVAFQFEIPVKYGAIRLKRVAFSYFMQNGGTGDALPRFAYTKANCNLVIGRYNPAGNFLFTQAVIPVNALTGTNGLEIWMHEPGQIEIEKAESADPLRGAVSLQTTDVTDTDCFFSVIIDVERVKT
jgi:hypothetical protein